MCAQCLDLPDEILAKEGAAGYAPLQNTVDSSVVEEAPGDHMDEPMSEDVAQAARELVIAESQPPALTPVVLDSVANLVTEYNECQNMETFWKKRREEIKTRLVEMLGESTSGTISGRTAVTYERIDQFNSTEFKKKYPQLWEVYQHTVPKKELDIALLKRVRPDLYAEFQTRKMLVPYKAPGS